MEKIKNLHFFTGFNAKNSSVKERFFIFQRVESPMPEPTPEPTPETAPEPLEEKKEAVERVSEKERRKESHETARGLTLDPLDQKLFDSILDDADEGANPALLGVSENIDKLINFAQTKDNFEKILDAIDDENIRIANLSTYALKNLLQVCTAEGKQEDLADKVYEATIKDKTAPMSKLAFLLNFQNLDGALKEELISDIFEALEDGDISSKILGIEMISVLFNYYTQKSDTEKVNFLLKECTKDGEITSKFLANNTDNEKAVRQIYSQIVTNPEIAKTLDFKAVTVLLKFYKNEQIIPLLSEDQKYGFIIGTDRGDLKKLPIIKALYDSLEPHTKELVDGLHKEEKKRKKRSYHLETSH